MEKLNNFDNFKNYMYLYKKSINIENKFKELGVEFNPELGIQLLIDELVSWIPDLIFNSKGCELFWNCIDYDFSEEKIEELWEKLKNYTITNYEK